MVKIVMCSARTSHEPIFIVEAASSVLVSKEIFFDRVARTHRSVVRSRASSACTSLSFSHWMAKLLILSQPTRMMKRAVILNAAGSGVICDRRILMLRWFHLLPEAMHTWTLHS